MPRTASGIEERIDRLRERLPALAGELGLPLRIVALVAVELVEPSGDGHGGGPMSAEKREAVDEAIRSGEPGVSICGRLGVSSATVAAMKKELHGEVDEPRLFPE
jgi:hypothetical protein